MEIKLYPIGNSDIAVKFEVAEKPNDWTKEIKKSSNDSPILQARYDYWMASNDYAFKNPSFAKEFNQRKPSTVHWMTLSAGSSACHIDISQIRKYKHLIVEWYISDDKELYQKFFIHKDEIESEMGIELEWNELPDKKASRIIAYTDTDFDNKNDWTNQFDWIMEVAVKMKKHLRSIYKVKAPSAPEARGRLFIVEANLAAIMCKRQHVSSVILQTEEIVEVSG